MAEKKKLPSVYIDACCFIDMVAFDVSASLSDARKKRVWFCKQMLKAAIDKKLRVYTSILTSNECVSVNGNVSDEVQRRFESILHSSNGVIPITATGFIRESARQLIWQHKLRLGMADSIHIASALKVQAAEFITSDGDGGGSKKIISQNDLLKPLGLNAITADQTQELPVEYKQLPLGWISP